MKTLLLREFVSLLVESGSEFNIDDLESVPNGTKFGNLDFALLLLLRNGPMKRGDVINAVRSWRGTTADDTLDTTGKPLIASSDIFTQSSAKYFKKLAPGIYTLSEPGMARTNVAADRAKVAISSKSPPKQRKPAGWDIPTFDDIKDYDDPIKWKAERERLRAGGWKDRAEQKLKTK